MCDCSPEGRLTAVLFGAYHWWTGVGNIIEALLMGVLLMLFYRRSSALWPVVLAHYLTDVVDRAARPICWRHTTGNTSDPRHGWHRRQFCSKDRAWPSAGFGRAGFYRNR